MNGKSRYSSHTASFKLKVIAYAETHGNRAAGREFTVPEFNIRYWRKQKQALQETNASRKAFRGPKSGKFPDLEDKLLGYTLNLRGEQRLRVFENKVLRKIFGAKRDEVTGEWRKLHNAELHALYSSPDIIRNIKSRRLRWAGRVARMGESINAYRLLVVRPEGKRPLRRPRCRWEDIIKMDLREMGYDGRDWINVGGLMDQWRGGNEPPGSLKASNIFVAFQSLGNPGGGGSSSGDGSGEGSDHVMHIVWKAPKYDPF
ncbi:hypothetical protein ANN_15321 [Periplaneta americana]|uniref:Brinker DNA-binding domain-containing protein n=1 Tax=Periplaneta americana TaxID=6978 RepID=A0ABQ8SG19_PERAM|nr:hypothetical protein ANN_15321 [Periplaneta americana]